MADPANTKLGRMLLDEITPVVMVLRTPLVEESCRKNGFSLIEMLASFSNFNNIDVPVRTASDQPYRLRKFRLRLFYGSEVRQPNIEVRSIMEVLTSALVSADWFLQCLLLDQENCFWHSALVKAAKERLKQVITFSGDKDISELCSDPPDIESLIATSKQELVPSWFQNFNKELIDVVAFSEHEAFDHPVACLVVVSSKDKDPIDKFVDLFNTNQLPPLLNDGAMDPKILKYFLLVHDNQDGMLEKASGILTEMRSTFGANDCRLLCINSSADGAEEHQENLWASYKTSISNNKQYGCFLNADDIEELRSTMHDFSSKHIIPHMELKIRVLNQQISATRRGFRNQIRNLWWRKGKDDAPENANGPIYEFWVIMLSCYGTMNLHYQTIAYFTDYKLDKAWKHYAGVQEMMGLAYFMLDQARKDAEYCMENAFTTYLKIGPSGGGNATRCGIWWAEMLKARDQFKDAAGVYFRISGEYGFHLVLSGDLYRKCDQTKHAIRTYRGALSVFKGTTWRHIRDHVHFHIGKWYAFLGMFDEAINVLEVLACGHQTKATQELFLREFFRIIQETGKTYEVLRLQLPVINFPLIKVVFEDHRTYASTAAASVRESLWKSWEDMIPSLSVIKTNWLESQQKVLPKKYKESNVCVAGEAIKVDISFRNPLQIPISISNVSLICKHSAEFDETESDANGFLIDHQNDKELRAVSNSGSSA
ncbi:Trafficking protein particle complex subunit [Sesamum angolense]|uniref:Trafficking protein particle complex subunit n=1 Tax=Sesamum angolense TaxID=2727404 RepID=A0AAE1WNL8_9LAMI|nr:Trafficking protein particle complex subunit [Sesamum angolense]